MQVVDNLKFYDGTDNLLPLLTVINGSGLDGWKLTDASLVDDHIVIAPDGILYTHITDITKLKACNNMLVKVSAEGEVNNYKSSTNIICTESYYLEDDQQNVKIDKRRSRSIGITPLSSELVGSIYNDYSILELFNYNMNDFYIKIINTSDENLTIHNFEVYRSVDAISDIVVLQEQVADLQEISNANILIIPVYQADPVTPLQGQIWIRG